MADELVTDLTFDNAGDPEFYDACSEYVQYALRDPVGYAEKAIGIKPAYPDQAAILEAVADPDIKRISWRSANGVGKTYLAATIICHYLDTHVPGYAVVSGASHKSIKKTIWPNLKRIVRAAPVELGGEMLTEEWNRGDMWGAFCVSPVDAENFAGFRTENGALVIVDEASSLPYETMQAINGVCSAPGSKIVLLGNPLIPEGPFYDSFQSSLWTNFHTSAFDVCDLGIPGLSDRQFIEDWAKEYGTDSPSYIARVKGEFPESTFDSLIKLAWLKRCIVPTAPRPSGRRRLGVDVARFGDDRTVLVVRDERSIIEERCYTKKSTMETTGIALAMAEEFNVADEDVFIDDTGLGGGVTDSMHEQGFCCTPVNFGEAAADRHKFANCRAELYWQIRNRMNPDVAGKKLLFFPRKFASIAKECTWPKYSLASDSRIILEPKEKIKKRKGRSPDESDALALTFAGDVIGASFESI